MLWRLWWINTLTFLKVSYAYRRVLVFASNMFCSVNSVGKVAHSPFLSVLVEVGLIRFALFGITLTIVVIQGLGQPKWDSSFWLTVLLVWALTASFMSWEQRKQTWLFLSLVIVSAVLSVRGDEFSLRTKFPVRSIELPKGETSEANDATHSPKGAAFGNADGHNRLPFSYKTDRGSQHLPYR